MNAPTKKTLENLAIKTQTALKRLASSEIIVGHVDGAVGIKTERISTTDDRRLMEYSFLPRGVLGYTWFPNPRNRLSVIQSTPHPSNPGAMRYYLRPAEGADSILQTIITIYPSYYLQGPENIQKHQNPKNTDATFDFLTATEFLDNYRALLQKRK